MEADSLPEYNLNGLFLRAQWRLCFPSKAHNLALHCLHFPQPVGPSKLLLEWSVKFCSVFKSISSPQPLTLSPPSPKAVPKNHMGNILPLSLLVAFLLAVSKDQTKVTRELKFGLVSRDVVHHGEKAWQQIPLHPESGSREQGRLMLSLLSPFYSVLSPSLWEHTTVRVCFPASLHVI